MKTLFAQNAKHGRLWTAILLSAGLLFADSQHQLEPAHAWINAGISYFYDVTYTPVDLFNWGNDTWASHQALLTENQQLKQKNLLLSQSLLKFKAIETENLKLKSLLQAAMNTKGHVKMADIVGIDPDPFSHEILLNRGSADGIKVGQPILGAEGLMGQIISVMNAHASRALLISDANHALPVQVNRNGVRAIAVGSGHLDKLYLAYLPDSADVKPGDLLISSGLGGRFPFGYPVATVTLVKHDPGAPFAVAEAKPKVMLDRLHQVLILTHQESEPLPPPGPWPTPASICPPAAVVPAATITNITTAIGATAVTATTVVESAESSSPASSAPPSIPVATPTHLPQPINAASKEDEKKLNDKKPEEKKAEEKKTIENKKSPVVKPAEETTEKSAERPVEKYVIKKSAEKNHEKPISEEGS